jgi:hypothetical protein
MAGKGRRGEFSKIIKVQTNDANSEKTAFVCKGKILVAEQIDIPMVNFGIVPRDGGPQTRTVTIRRGDGGPLSPELEPIKESQLSAQLREITPGEEYKLDVTLNPPWPVGDFNGQLTIKTGVAEEPIDTIRATARIPLRLRASPAMLRIPQDRSKELQLATHLAWSGKNPGKVLEATCSDPQLAVRLEERGGGTSVVLTVPAGYKGMGTAAITVKTDDELMPTIRIPVLATINRALTPPRTRPPAVRAAPTGRAAPAAPAPARPARAGTAPTTQPASP